MPCIFCIRLQEAVVTARRPDPPNLSLGLSEVGLRNRARQKEEQILKAEENLKKHQRACEDRDAF
jgi:hypothetical protein